jgi:sulfur-carrier protein
MARLVLFGPAREAAGVSTLALPATTVAGVIAEAERCFGEPFARVVATSNVWVNGREAEPDVALGDDDEVAVLPPVSGG